MRHSPKIRLFILSGLCLFLAAACQLGPVPRRPEEAGGQQDRQRPGNGQQGQPGQTGPQGPGMPAPQSEAETRIAEFAARGFGFDYREDERLSMSLFIRRHGRPISRIDSQAANRHDGIRDTVAVLRYRGFQVRFLNYSPRTQWKPPESTLEAIYSVDGARYLYGVQTGMPRVEIVRIFNLYDRGGASLEMSNDAGNYATFIFDNGKLKSIVWEYGRQ